MMKTDNFLLASKLRIYIGRRDVCQRNTTQRREGKVGSKFASKDVSPDWKASK